MYAPHGKWLTSCEDLHWSDESEHAYSWTEAWLAEYSANTTCCLLSWSWSISAQINKQDYTLAELFSKIPLHYSLSSDEEELTTYMEYRELITDYARTRRITADQQTELVAILDKRLARGSRI